MTNSIKALWSSKLYFLKINDEFNNCARKLKLLGHLNWLVLSTWTCRRVWTRGVPWTRDLPDEQGWLPMPMWPRFWRGPVRIQWVVVVGNGSSVFLVRCRHQQKMHQNTMAFWLMIHYTYYMHVCIACSSLEQWQMNEYLYNMHAFTFLSLMECACNMHTIFR